MSLSSIAAASTATSSTSSSSSAGSSTEIAGNFQQFLTLLTTQLQNQNPLDPLDTNQFTQQLVQFASVEQQLKTNDQLSSILTATKATSTANAASYIGMSVTADGSVATLANNSATWTVTPAKAAAKAVMTIKNSAGTVVSTQTATLKAGQQTFSWNGQDSTGAAQAAGDYTLSISATDATGATVAVATDIAGTVSAVNVSGTAPVLTVAGQAVPIARIKTVASQ